MSLKPKKTKLTIGEATYSLYRITPPKPKLEGVEVTSLDDDTVKREPGDVLDMGETIEAELVYSSAIFAALQGLQAASASDGSTHECSIVYADATEDPFMGWVQEVGKSEAQVKGEPIKILLTLGIAGPMES
jgi:hypothetical protein